jgi:hypothetical protein
VIADWKGDLLKERSLQEVFRASRKLPKSPFNKFVYAVCGILIFAIATTWSAKGDVTNSAQTTRLAAEIAFDLSVQILGFLIGGFAIFATVTDDRLMIRLAQVKMTNSEHSVFKHVFFNFLSVFYIFIVALGASVLVKMLGSLDIININYWFEPENGDQIIAIINSIAFCLLAALILLCVVRLKSFIWNIYQGFLTFLIVSDGMESRSGDDCP